MAIVALSAKPKNKDYSYQAFVSIIIPAYNEERYIIERIQNLLSLDYPKNKYEIIIVESGSTDNTAQVVADFIANYKLNHPRIRLLKEGERKGMASAINFGKKHAIGDIVMTTGAHCYFEEDVLKEIIPHFKDEKVGGVDGRYMVLSAKNHLCLSSSLYWDIEDIMRRGESILDSVCLWHGEINAWRKELVEADPTIISEDLDMPIRIRRKGYKIHYEPKAIVYEPSPSHVWDQIEQRKRNSIGTLQCIFKHLDYLLPPRNLYGAIILPSHKILPMFSPFILLGIAILYIIAWDIRIVISHLIINAFIFGVLLLTFLLTRSRVLMSEQTKDNFSGISLIKSVYYILLLEYSILIAWKDFMLKKYQVTWHKVRIDK
jgi:cellulose synthase/poly-beta-1,6-N-acetylglucosamine synthase-like glycosyltransferase